MAGLTRVPAPGSPFDRRSAAFGGLLVVMIVALAVEPWGSTGPPPEPTPSPYRAPSPIVAVTALGSSGPAPVLRSYRPEAFGPAPADTTWTIRTPRQVVEV